MNRSVVSHNVLSYLNIHHKYQLIAILYAFKILQKLTDVSISVLEAEYTKFHLAKARKYAKLRAE